MNSTLTQSQKDEIRNALLNNTFSMEAEVARLMSRGYEEDYAKSLIVAELREYRQELFNKKLQRDNSEDTTKVIWIGIGMISMIGPLFDIRSPLWYIVVLAASGVGGYFAYKTKPIAGLAGAVIMPLVFPFSYHWYFSGRSHYIRIEMIIPLLVALIPAVLVYFIIAKTVYANKEAETF
jgi:hypothetical protein